MSKKIVTHFAPDLDAITSIWLIKRFMPGWEEAEVLFVPAGETLNDEPVDSAPNILHVDTGLGRFDHHQLDADQCAAKKVFEFLRRERKAKRKNWNEEALERLVEVVNDIDHFREVFWPNPTADFYNFTLEEILDGLKLIYSEENEKIVEFGLTALDGVYKKLQNKVWAERLLKEKGVEFKTKWGRSIAVETTNDETLHLAQKMGFKIVLRKDPKRGHVRIKARPEGINLGEVFGRLKRADRAATWYLHSSGCMILNGSTKNPKTKPTNLSLAQIIEILKS